MNDRVETASRPSAKLATDFDAIVIGAGVSGLYQALSAARNSA